MFGRRYEHDERNLRHLLAPPPPTRTSKTWGFFHPPYDQGQHGTCVGHGGKDQLVSTPKPQTPYAGAPTPIDVYQMACRNDGFHGGKDDPTLDTGSSVLGLMRGLKAAGLIQAYGWAYDAPTVRDWVLTRGPVVIGVNWYSSMTQPTGDGMLYVEDGATIVGGHCVLLLGYSKPRDAFRLLNSWGPGWGQNGRAWLPTPTLTRLLAEQGEAATPTE